MAYAAWEWALLGVSVGITVIYHGVFGLWFRSRITRYQNEVMPVWAYIHEQSCKQSILMIQMMRNLMAIVTGLCAITVAILLLVVKMRSQERKAEVAAVAIVSSAAILMYVMSASLIGSLTFNIALYPTDLSKEVHPKVVVQNRLKTREQLTMLSRHYGLAKRLTLIAIQCLFLLIHPIAFLSATVMGTYFYVYMDTRLGIRLGGINLGLLSWGVTLKTMEGAARAAQETTSISMHEPVAAVEDGDSRERGGRASHAAATSVEGMVAGAATATAPSPGGSYGDPETPTVPSRTMEMREMEAPPRH